MAKLVLPPTASKIQMKKAASIGLMSIALGGGMIAQAAPAFAAPVSITQNEQANPGATDGSEFWNRFTLSNGMLAFCDGDPQNPAPLGVAGYDDANIKTVDGEFTTLGDGHFTADAGHQAAYILSVHGNDADAAAVQYAVQSLANPYYPGDARGVSAASQAKAEQFKAEAAAEAGKYVNFQSNFESAKPVVTVDSKAMTGTVETTAPAGDYTFTVTLGGGATFADGSTTATVNANDQHALDIVIPEGTPAGDITANLEAKDVPDTTFHILESADHQDLFLANNVVGGAVSAAAAFTPEAPKPETTPPTVSTVASDDVELKDGKAQVFDNLKVEGDVPEGAYATVDLHYFGEDENAPAKCDASTVVGTSEKIAVTGAGDYKTENFEVTKAGKYGFRETLFDKDGNILHQGECGTESETVIVKEAPKTETPAPTPTPETPKPETPAPSTPVNVNVENHNENNNTVKVEQHQQQAQEQKQSQEQNTGIESTGTQAQVHGQERAVTQKGAVAAPATQNVSTAQGTSRAVSAQTGIEQQKDNPAARIAGTIVALFAVVVGVGYLVHRRFSKKS